MAEPPLAGRAALVTGGARNLGAAIALRLAGLGCPVAVHHNASRKEALALVARLRSHGRIAAAVQADLSDPKAARALIPAAEKALGRPIELLVNNAASFLPGRLGDLTWGRLEDSLKLDAWAPFELTRAFAARLGPRRRGTVVNLLDARIEDYDWDHVGYFLAKRLLADLTRLSAVAYAPRVTVNGVAPGPVTDPPGEAGFLERIRKHLPLRRTPTPGDVADAVAYLLGARNVTGEVLFVDGGRHLGRAVYG